MKHAHTEDCCKFLFAIFRLESSTMWGFNIGEPHEGQVITLATKGSYKSKREATIAASAFIEGMKFNLGGHNETA